MSQSRFAELFSLSRPLIFDGGMGTMLQARGLPAGMSPEAFCLEREDVLLEVHRLYLDAGADIITTCTFGASPFKLDPGLDVFETCRRLAMAARRAADSAGRPVLVAGDVGPTGHFARPLGDLEPEELIAGLEAQIRGLAAGGCDCILLETQFDLAETRAGVAACRRACDLPVLASMTFEDGASLTGSTPEIFAETMQNLGVAALGTNCSVGPEAMGEVLRRLLAVSSVPVFAEPNAGMPQLVDGRTVFPLGPERFAELTAAFADMGARCLGGCCGTTPDHIAALKKALDGHEPDASLRVEREHHEGIVLTSRQELVRVGADEPFVIIGERINPTGKKQLTAELQEGVFTTAMDFAESQVSFGARVLDVNVGAHNVDQVSLLPRLVSELIARHTIPLSLDSSDDAAILAALPWCPASFLVNSINGHGDRMQRLGAACRDFGMPFILLPMRDAKLPVKASERIAILEGLISEAESLGISRRLMIVDVLALAISSKGEGAVECLKLLDWCRENHLATTIGLSNLSFGLPARELVNSSFLVMGAGRGLTSCIANPGSARIREAVASADLLLQRDAHAERFIAGYADWKSGAAPAGQAPAPGAPSASADRPGKGPATTPYEAVLKGDREHVLPLVQKELDKGEKAFDIVNGQLIPAITEVGRLYEKKIYFLPQLIRSAETMQTGFGHLKPLLTQSAEEKRPTVVLATVEGDVHDIGKNIVGLMLSNHGFTVVDAGKDVPAAKILDLAVEHKASLIGLSALMTTTMVRMEDTIRGIRDRDLDIRVMVGGAAVTRAFAESIGADAYCVDAVEAVAAAKRLTER
ncbi:MAG: homocysteine S-methyltransferase family protein [Desulfovibrionaceae bacterium]|nr:homocysteine S-methyltransferase family protein [Desulfovibrionaceae bacterium]